MALKLGRNYSLLIQQADNALFTEPILIEPPYTVEFDILQTNYSSANVAKLKIMNLAPNTRNQIRFDQNSGLNRQVLFQAGYSNLSTVLDNNIQYAYSVREKHTWTTCIESYDGGYAKKNAFTSFPVGTGTDQASILQSLVGDLLPYGLTVGQISPSFSGPIPKGQAIQGFTMDLLHEITGGAFYVYNSKVYIVTNDEYVAETRIPTISATTGLLGTPKREINLITFDMLFEPSLTMCQLVNLQSQEENVNGIYKIVGLHHKGTISGAVCGDAITTVTMQGNQFNSVSEVLIGNGT